MGKNEAIEYMYLLCRYVSKTYTHELLCTCQKSLITASERLQEEKQENDLAALLLQKNVRYTR